MPEIKWLEVQKDYNLGIAPRELAIKYNIPDIQLKRHIANNKWGDKKKSFQAKIIDSQAERIKRLTDKALNRIEQKLDAQMIKDNDLATFARLVIDISGLKSETINNNNKNVRSADDLPDEFEMLRDRLNN